MEILIKLAPRDYYRLRSHVPNESAAYEVIEKASRIDHSIEGVLFSGYTIRCDERQAAIILGIAKPCCPDIVPAIDEAITLAQSR